MARGFYTVSIRISGLSTAKTLLTLVPINFFHAEVVSASVTNESLESGEQLQASLNFYNTGSAVGTTVTPAKHEAGDQSAQIQAKGNLTSEPTYSVDPIWAGGFTNSAAWVYKPRKKNRPFVVSSQKIGLRLLTTPSTPFDCVARITFQEFGILEIM